MSNGDLFLLVFLILYWLVVILVCRASKGWLSIFLYVSLVVPSVIGSVFVSYIRYFK